MRPADEYQPPTDTEWTEFEEHFDKRKVEVGTCGRPYGTGCQHEHACLRCPVLQVAPRMLSRLDEIEGLDLTLSFLRAPSRAYTQRFTRKVHLRLHGPRQLRP